MQGIWIAPLCNTLECIPILTNKMIADTVMATANVKVFHMPELRKAQQWLHPILIDHMRSNMAAQYHFPTPMSQISLAKSSQERILSTAIQFRDHHASNH